MPHIGDVLLPANHPADDHTQQSEHGMSETIAAVLGVIVGWALALLTGWWERRRKHRDEFAADVDAVRRELAARADNLDRDFVDWHLASVRRLRIHGDYFRLAQPKWWRKAEQTWTDYEMPDQPHTVEAFLARRVDRKELLSRLTRLLHVIRAA